MREITKQELEEILEKHLKWLKGEKGGERANLSYVNLSYADLSFVNLSYADLSNANLFNANLFNANLSNANLSYANLSYANLSYINLVNADLPNVDLSSANLDSARLNDSEKCRLGIVLQEPRIGYKKCGNYIVQLSIPKGAIVFSINNNRCRTNKATPIAILKLDGTISNRKTISSDYDNDFKYKLMEEIEIQDFNLIYNIESASGIHFFWDIESASDYK